MNIDNSDNPNNNDVITPPTIDEIKKIARDWVNKRYSDQTSSPENIDAAIDFEEIIKILHNIYSFKDVKSFFAQKDKSASEIISIINAKTLKIVEEHDQDGNWKKKYPITSQDICHSGDFWQDLLFPMVAYLMESSDYYHKGSITKIINERIEFGNDYLRMDRVHDLVNWWATDIGIPRDVLKILFLDINNDIIIKENKIPLVEFLFYIGFYPKGMGFIPDMEKGMLNLKAGMNLLWVNYNFFQTAILFSRMDYLRVAIQSINSIISVHKRWTGDGVAPDGSFHQHCQPKITGINMGYGSSFIETASLYFYVMNFIEKKGLMDSSLKIDEQTTKDFKKFIEFAIWNNWNSEKSGFLSMNYWSKGRSASRHHSIHRTGGFPGTLIHAQPLLLLDNPIFSEIQNIILKMIMNAIDSGNISIYKNIQPLYFSAKIQQKILLLKKKSEENQNNNELFEGAKHFPHGRLLIHRNQEHLVAIQLNDLHHKTYFSIHQENKTGYHLNEGSIYYLTPKIRTTTETQFAYPWNSVLGTTNISDKHATKERFARSRKVSAGSMDNTGIIGFIFRQNGIKAWKSYHFIDDLLFIIGSKIRRDFEWRPKYRKVPVTTTIFLEPFAESELIDKTRDNTNPLYFSKDIGVKILHHANFKDENPIVKLHSNVDLDPRDVNERYAPSNIQRINCLWNIVKFNHGLKPKNQEFSCVLGFGLNELEFKEKLDDLDYSLEMNATGHSLLVKKSIDKQKIFLKSSTIFMKPGEMLTNSMDQSGAILWELEINDDENQNLNNASDLDLSQIRDYNRLKLFVSLNITRNILKKRKFPKKVTVRLPFILQELVQEDSRILSIIRDDIIGATELTLSIKDLSGEKFIF